MKKNYMIGVDCEGVACVVGTPGETLSNSKQFPFACRQATREASAAAEALFEAGAERVVVWDNHARSGNLDYELLDSRCEIAVGCVFPHRWPGLDDTFGGILFVGYHAMGGAANAPLAHSYNSREIQWIQINDRMVGEMAIDAACAGEVGVPSIFVASDDKAVAEARSFFGDIPGVETKQGYGIHTAISLHPDESVRRIRETVRAAAERAEYFKPFTFKSPMTYRIRFQRFESVEEHVKNGWERVDGLTVEKKLTRITELY